MTAHFGNRSGSGVEIGADEIAPLLGIELRGDAGRADEIAEHDGEVAPFTRGFSASTLLRRAAWQAGFTGAYASGDAAGAAAGGVPFNAAIARRILRRSPRMTPIFS